MKKQSLAIIIIVCLILSLSAVPAFASKSLTTVSSTQSTIGEGGTQCSKCGRVFTGADGEQSRLAMSLGLTLCMDCWLDAFYGSNRSSALPNIAKLNGGGKIDPEYLGGEGSSNTTYLRGDLTWVAPPSGGSPAWGSITGTMSSQTDLQEALGSKEPAITPGVSEQYWRGDKTWQTLPAMHSHGNGVVLDNIQESLTTALKSAYDSAVAASHGHTNQSTLDSIQEAFTTALKSTYDALVADSHTHSNKATLDSITAAFTTGLKSTYDATSSAFTSAWKTTVDTFIGTKGQASGLASLDASSKVVQDPASKGTASGIAPLDASSKIPTVNLGGSGASASTYLRGDQTWASVAGGTNPAWYGKLYGTRGDCDPAVQALHENMLSVAGPTPTGITASVARTVMFTPPANITVTNIRLFGVGSTTNLYKFAIYPVGAGSAKAWDSGTVTTAANTWLNLTSGLPVTLTAGTKYWWCVTVVSTGTTAGFRSEAAPLGTNYWGAAAAPIGSSSLDLPVYAQFTVSTGVFPATLPTIAAAAYSGGTTGSVPFGWLDYGGAK